MYMQRNREVELHVPDNSEDKGHQHQVVAISRGDDVELSCSCGFPNCGHIGVVAARDVRGMFSAADRAMERD